MDPKREIENKEVGDLPVNRGLNIQGRKIKKGISTIKGSRIALKNNEIKDIVKVIRSLESK